MEIKKLVYEKIKKLIKTKFNDDSDIKDIGIDSLDFVELITEAEDILKISISDDELESIKTIKDIVAILSEKIKAKNKEK